ncbi:hypothetical protein NKH34_29765 [Mesorhizobium sp. M1148]|nr:MULTISPECIES: hypothetical protein [unclassified Mesorhizobium]WJI76983.1 hypothetical protein NLY37_09925 [Mesorhizobium sp. C395A]
MAGAGKTTTLEILERLGEGARIYVGSFVTAEVARRGMAATPQNERLVREELRAFGGMAVLAQLAFPTINGIISAGRNALVDAIYCVEEYQFYLERCDRVVRIAVETAKPERERRLAVRALRPLDADALTKRDEFEMSNLGLAGVMAAAEHRIINDGSLDDLERALLRIIDSLRA